MTANSYLYLTRAMDYFDIAADHDGVLAQAWWHQTASTTWCRSPLTGCSRPRIARVHALNASSARVSSPNRNRSRPTPSCSTCPNSSTFRALSPAIRRPPRPERQAVDMSRQQTCLAGVGRIAPRFHRSSLGRRDGQHGSRCSTSAAATATSTPGRPRHRRPRHRTVARCQLRRRGSPWCRATPIDLVNYPDDAFDCVTIANAAGDAAAKKNSAGKRADRTAPSSRSISVLEDAAAIAGRRSHAAHQPPGTTPEHPLLHHQGFRAAHRGDQRQDGARSSISTAARCGCNLPWWFWNIFGERAWAAEPGAGK